jgi:hypothetical protein
MDKSTWFGGGAKPLPKAALLGGVLALSLAACDSALDVEDPDIADPTGFADETALPSVRAGAIFDFGFAVSGNGGGTEGQVITSALLADEFVSSGTFPTRVEIDIRIIENNNATLQTVTRNLYRARTSAESGIALFEQFGANTAGHAEVLNLAGLTFIYFAEHYCSGVPFSNRETATFGMQETTQQILARAVDRADRAIAAATAAGSSTQLDLARVVKGRALLDMGQYAAAAAAVAGVSDDFVYRILRSENTFSEQNGVYVFSNLSERFSVFDMEGINGLPYRTHMGGTDPRTPWRRLPATDVGFDQQTPQYDERKYITRSDPIPVATGAEARLIEAEAALQAGDAATFLTKLNDARAADLTLAIDRGQTGATLPPLTAADVPADMAGRVDLLFAERAYSMWLTAHRLGDMRRLIRQYGRAQDNVFPTGAYHKNSQGGIYGTEVNLPITVDERNNPNFASLPEGDLCLNRDA